MKASILLSATTLILVAHAHSLKPPVTTPPKSGLDFFMIGDYGYVGNLAPSHLTFNAMNAIIANRTNGERDQIDFILTMGDNLYPKIDEAPTDAEFDLMMTLFSEREELKELPIYPVRGNHDCYFDINRELELAEQYPNWKMPSLYHAKLFDIGNNKKFGVLFVDSCLAICSNYSYANGTGGHMLFASHEMIKLRDVQCNDPVITAKGFEMFQWMTGVMKEWDADESIVWKATVQHHPLFGKWYPDY